MDRHVIDDLYAAWVSLKGVFYVSQNRLQYISWKGMEEVVMRKTIYIVKVSRIRFVDGKMLAFEQTEVLTSDFYQERGNLNPGNFLKSEFIQTLIVPSLSMHTKSSFTEK